MLNLLMISWLHFARVCVVLKKYTKKSKLMVPDAEIYKCRNAERLFST